METDPLSEVDQGMVIEIISSPLVPWFVLGFFLLIFAVISIVLVYHWNRYGAGNRHVALVEIIYFPVAFILIGLISFALVMYGQS